MEILKRPKPVGKRLGAFLSLCAFLYIESLPAQALLQTHKPVIADDQVIQQLDVQHFPGLGQLLGNCNILGRRVGSPLG
jgi:hypothetical protein